MKLKNIIILGAAAVALTACDDLFEPAIENNQDINQMFTDADFARGILDNAYLALPYSAMPTSDVATDDAVSNDFNNNYLKMATGNWSSMFNPMNMWEDRYHAIQYCNLMIKNADQVTWAYSSPVLNQMFADNYKGNAYGLRALHHFFALRAHCGRVGGLNGELMGIPYHKEFVEGGANFNESRETFANCVKFILEDLDEASKLLPESYGNGYNDAFAGKYNIDENHKNEYYNKAFGEQHRGKIDGLVISALKAQVALFAASPAYADASGVSMQKAAELAADCLAKIGNNLDAIVQQDGWKIFNDNDFLKKFGATSPNTAEIIWRANINNTNDYEMDMYPPTLDGNGRVNPSQNLVDAFPMANGYPISDKQHSGYNDQDPYANRDPRLATYIICNGAKFGSADAEVWTKVGEGATTDGMNVENGKSTRTGYYLRKLLRNDINCNPNSASKENHLQLRIRTTEILLAYAEAANAAGGPTAKYGNAKFSAYDVINALRQRAGVAPQGDLYLESCYTDAAKMEQLIRNERRIELCFENHRFWDLRRWKENLNEPVRGMKIEGGVYTVVPVVEERQYKDYMYYAPLPYSECMKWSNLKQNFGW